MFGSAFLSKFEASQTPAKLLEDISIIDTPGVLSGEKQRIDRGYSFVSAGDWPGGDHAARHVIKTQFSRPLVFLELF